MSTSRYLLDTSALARIQKVTAIAEQWQPHVAAGLLAVCPVVELEFLYSARSMDDRVTLVDLMESSYAWALMPDRAFERAAEVQAELTARGTYRSAGPVDLLVAATAELHGLTLLHYDRDFEHIGTITDQPMAWLAPPGSIA